jgi:hypothetical protein
MTRFMPTPLPRARIIGLFACLIAGGASAQQGGNEAAPLPPLRPFDMDMPATRPNIVTPPRASGTSGSTDGAPPGPMIGTLQLAPAPPSRPASLPRAASVDAEEPAQAQNSFFGGFSFPGILTPSVPPVPSPEVPPAPQPAAPQTASVQQPEPKQERQWPFRLPWQREDPAESAPVDDTPTGPGITTDPGTSITCLPPRLKTVLNKVVAKYGSVRVTSTYRPAWRARRGSYHRRCEAVDFRVPGHRPGEVMGLIRTFEETGGRKVYWNGLIHVDIGPDRPW